MCSVFADQRLHLGPIGLEFEDQVNLHGSPFARFARDVLVLGETVFDDVEIVRIIEAQIVVAKFLVEREVEIEKAVGVGSAADFLDVLVLLLECAEVDDGARFQQPHGVAGNGVSARIGDPAAHMDSFLFGPRGAIPAGGGDAEPC